MLKLLKNNYCGYTFVELLIALALLGIVLAPLINLFATAYNSISNARMHTIALNLCRSRLEETRALGYSNVVDTFPTDPSSPVSEEDPAGFTGFTRETRVSLVNLPASASSGLSIELLQIDVTVSWQENSLKRKETLSTYLGKR